jgi:maltooligosyltrehalose trehalohydrolase
VRAGRREFLAQFPSLANPEIAAAVPSPVDESTFLRSKIDWADRERHGAAYALHRDLLHLRRSDPVIKRAGRERPDGAVLAPQAFLLRYFGGPDGDRLLIVNLGPDLDLRPLAEPLLAPPQESRWTLQWNSASVRYGGQGAAPLRPHAQLHVQAESAVLLASERGPIEDDGGE